LYRFYSTHDPETLTSLDEYISRMKSDQDTILYLPGDSKDAILKSPILKKYQKMGYEVLILGDPIDEFCVQHLSEYEKRKVKSIAKDDVNILDSDEVSKKKLQKLKEMYKPLTEWFKNHLGKQVEKVTITNKLDEDPVYILTSQYGYSASMEKINRAQAFANQEKAASYMLAKKTLELNPHHPVIKEMLSKVKVASSSEDISQEIAEYADLLYNMALLNSGFLIENPADFTQPLQKLLRVGFGIRKDAPIEEIEVDISSIEDAEGNTEEPDVEGEVEVEDDSSSRQEEL
jgi:heat shock protein 90kDa beta